jgi:DNA repair photolyase
MIKHIHSKSALNRLHSNFLPYKWDLNIYRGCSHRCQYCYALYSHQYLENEDFFGTIFVKENIVDLLEQELAAKKWQHEVINLGGVTDSYQAIEAQEKIMPRILELLIKHKNPVTISTKSKLILRDIELWDKLAHSTTVSLAVSLTTFDPAIYPKTEPGSSKPTYRLEVLKAFRQTNVKLGVLAMPILPYLTDSDSNIDELFQKISQVPIDYMFCQLLNLRGRTKPHFLNFIKQNFPLQFAQYSELYNGSFVNKEFRESFLKRVYLHRKKYNIPHNYQIHKQQEEQLGLL